VNGPWRVIRNLSSVTWALLACNQTAAPTTVYLPIVSSLIVSPDDFLGDEPCSDEAGAVRTYQATLVDVTEGEEDAEALPSSEITSCQAALLFESVVVDRRYIARIDAYDRSDLSTREKGAHGAVDENGDSVAPTWTTTCLGDYNNLAIAGEANGPADGVWVYKDTRLFVRGCGPLERQGAAGPTGVVFEFAKTFPGLTCGTDASSFSVRVSAGGDGLGGAPGSDASSAGAAGESAGGAGGVPGSDVSSSPCDTAIRILDLNPNQSYHFEVEAFASAASEASGEPAWQTSCSAVTASGVERTPSCEPFQSTFDE
jgi:hypothetical protein